MFSSAAMFALEKLGGQQRDAHLAVDCGLGNAPGVMSGPLDDLSLKIFHHTVHRVDEFGDAKQ